MFEQVHKIKEAKTDDKIKPVLQTQSTGMQSAKNYPQYRLSGREGIGYDNRLIQYQKKMTMESGLPYKLSNNNAVQMMPIKDLIDVVLGKFAKKLEELIEILKSILNFSPLEGLRQFIGRDEFFTSITNQIVLLAGFDREFESATPKIDTLNFIHEFVKSPTFKENYREYRTHELSEDDVEIPFAQEKDDILAVIASIEFKTKVKTFKNAKQKLIFKQMENMILSRLFASLHDDFASPEEAVPIEEAQSRQDEVMIHAFLKEGLLLVGIPTKVSADLAAKLHNPIVEDREMRGAITRAKADTRNSVLKYKGFKVMHGSRKIGGGTSIFAIEPVDGFSLIVAEGSHYSAGGNCTYRIDTGYGDWAAYQGEIACLNHGICHTHEGECKVYERKLKAQEKREEKVKAKSASAIKLEVPAPVPAKKTARAETAMPDEGILLQIRTDIENTIKQYGGIDDFVKLLEIQGRLCNVIEFCVTLLGRIEPSSVIEVLDFGLYHIFNLIAMIVENISSLDEKDERRGGLFKVHDILTLLAQNVIAQTIKYRAHI